MDLCEKQDREEFFNTVQKLSGFSASFIFAIVFLCQIYKIKGFWGYWIFRIWENSRQK